MPRLIFDVDNVLANSMLMFCKLASIKIGKKVLLDEIRSHKVVGSVDLPPLAIFSTQTEVWDRWREIDLIDVQAREILKDLKTNGFNISFASSAPQRNIVNMIEWLSYHNLDEWSLMTTRQRGRRVWKASKGAEFLIDDDPEEIVASEQYGAKGIIFDRPWNHRIENGNYQRAYSFSDVARFVKE